MAAPLCSRGAGLLGQRSIIAALGAGLDAAGLQGLLSLNGASGIFSGAHAQEAAAAAAAAPGGGSPRRAGAAAAALPPRRRLHAAPPAGAAAAAAAAADPAAKPGDAALSLKASLIFDASWRRAEARLGSSLVCPREVVWLNGAPGSGKGTNAEFIMRSRGFSCCVSMSQMLAGSPEIRAIIDRGELVPDAMVLDALLDAALSGAAGNDGAGLVIDGFPRTALQVDFVKLLYDRLAAAHAAAADGPDEWRFPRPSFKVVILYVDEEESVRRQTKRAALASLHNKRALDAGAGDLWDVRTTDANDALCRRRYQVFKAHYHTILRLKSFFPFSLIDAMGTLDETRAQIVRELRYQSSLDLDERTYAAIRHLPLARDLVRVARQRLVFRLDAYCKRQPALFAAVVRLIEAEAMPLLKQCSLAGHAELATSAGLLEEHPAAVDMLIDVLSDRGFAVAHSREERLAPRRVDLATGEIACDAAVVHKFRITFDAGSVRDLAAPPTVTTREGEAVAIGATYLPRHMVRERAEGVGLDGAGAPPEARAAGDDGAAAGGGGSVARGGGEEDEGPWLRHAGRGS